MRKIKVAVHNASRVAHSTAEHFSNRLKKTMQRQEKKGSEHIYSWDRLTTWRCDHPIDHIEQTKLYTLRTFERYFGNRDASEVAADLIEKMRIDLTGFLRDVTFGSHKHAW